MATSSTGFVPRSGESLPTPRQSSGSQRAFQPDLRDAGRMSIDLNADLGESFGAWHLGADEALLNVITSANVACGFHAGDPVTMRRTAATAASCGVTIGAHPGYRDLAGFGRRFLDIAPEELAADVLYQLGALDAACRAAGTKVSYVKPHGALYNAIVHHEPQARAVVEAVAAFDPSLPIMGLPGSAVLREAKRLGLQSIVEAFADRAYTPEGTLVSRGEPHAVLDDVTAVVAQALRFATDGTVVAVDGSVVQVDPASLCVHGDTPGAASLAAAVRNALNAAGVKVEPFAP